MKVILYRFIEFVWFVVTLWEGGRTLCLFFSFHRKYMPPNAGRISRIWNVSVSFIWKRTQFQQVYVHLVCWRAAYKFMDSMPIQVTPKTHWADFQECETRLLKGKCRRIERHAWVWRQIQRCVLSIVLLTLTTEGKITWRQRQEQHICAACLRSERSRVFISHFLCYPSLSEKCSICKILWLQMLHPATDIVSCVRKHLQNHGH
jgi:hypothetical protein